MSLFKYDWSKIWKRGVRKMFKYLRHPLLTLEKILWSKEHKKIRSANRRIRAEEVQLLKNISTSLGDDPSINVSEKLRQLDNLSQVLDLQRKIKLGEYGKWVFITVCVLALLAQLPGLPTPGHVEVQSKAVEITLSEDFEWSGTLNTIADGSILLSQFTNIYSPQSTELSLPLEPGVLELSSTSRASLESLFIPKGARLWLEWNEKQSALIFIMTTSTPNVSDELAVTAEFKLDGDSHFVIANGETNERQAIPCPMEDECSIPRRVLVSSTLGETPRIRLITNGLVDLAGIEANQFSFSKYTLDDTKRNGGRCTVTAGEYQMRGSNVASSLRKGECMLVNSIEGSMGIEMPIREGTDQKQGFQVWYHGMIESMKVGTPEFTEERTPNLLAFLLGIPGVSTIGSILGVILATGFAVIRVRQ